MKPDYLQTTEEVLSTQGSSSRGLTGEEAAARLSKHGPNRLQEAKKITNFQRFLQQLTDLSLKEIGSELGGQHYTTVISSINKIKSEMRDNPEVANIVKDLISNLSDADASI